GRNRCLTWGWASSWISPRAVLVFEHVAGADRARLDRAADVRDHPLSGRPCVAAGPQAAQGPIRSRARIRGRAANRAGPPSRRGRVGVSENEPLRVIAISIRG